METLIINSNSQKDINLILAFAKNKGIDVKLVPKNTSITEQKKDWDKIKSVAKELDATSKPKLSMQDIVKEGRIVRKKNYEKRIKNSN